MHEGPELSTTPPVPAQRVPAHDSLPPAPSEPGDTEETEPGDVGETVASGPASAEGTEPGDVGETVASGPASAAESVASVLGAEETASPDPGEADAAGPSGDPGMGARPKPRWRVRALLGGAAIAVLVAGFLLAKPGSGPEAAAHTAPSQRPASSRAPAKPFDQAVAALDAQATALVKGDENGWLAAVDPKLQGRYRSLFRNLRGLGVVSLRYAPGPGQPVKGDRTAVAIPVSLVYCFTVAMCPDSAYGREQAPGIAQKLTLKPAGGAYVITAVAAAPNPDYPQPTPWESGDLTFAQGKRVVVAAGAGEQKYLNTVLPVAERAATVADHYATLNGTALDRYRIFLASDKQWTTWYGGETDRWAIGLAMSLNQRGIDVVLRMSQLDDALTLSITVQHELGHVVTLTGAFRAETGANTWLSEGIAEYIGWKPRSAAQSLRRYSVRWQLNRSPMRSMVRAQPGLKSSARAGDAFYGLSHLAVDCMAHKYGDAKLLEFVRLVLADGDSLEEAAHDAYGVPFKTVDKTCVAWIKRQV
jgi:hypothetical protein